MKRMGFLNPVRSLLERGIANVKLAERTDGFSPDNIVYSYVSINYRVYDCFILR